MRASRGADKDVAVVFATHDRPRRLQALLDSLAAQTLPSGRFEVVVVDDGSGPETADVLEAELGAGRLDLRVLRHDPARGPATARDAGWRASSAPLVAFTDDDCRADERWLERLLAAAQAHPGAIVQGRTDPEPAEEHLRSPFSRTMVVHAAGPEFETCNILYPRDVLEAVDGFDLAFPSPAGEDTDLAWRAIDRGVGATFADDALVFHAVEVLGPVGMLRHAWRWQHAVPVFAKHPRLRREQLHHRLFWSPVHEQLLLALAAVVLARRVPLLAALLAAPYVKRLAWRRTGPLLAPFILAQDAVETASILRGAARHRVLVV